MLYRLIPVLLTVLSAIAAQVQSPNLSAINVRGAELTRFIPRGPWNAGPNGVDGVVSIELSLSAKGEVTGVRILSGPPELHRAAFRMVLDWPFKPGPAVAYADIEFQAKQGISLVTNAAPQPPFPAGNAIRVGADVQAQKLLAAIEPAFPPLARQAGISGVVKFNALIGKDGDIVRLQLVMGHPLLVQSATEAVRRARYSPTLLNGEPVEVSTEILVPFNAK